MCGERYYFRGLSWNTRALKAGQQIKLVFMGVTSETPWCLSVVKTWKLAACLERECFMGGKIQQEFNLSVLLLRYILTDTSGLSPHLASRLVAQVCKWHIAPLYIYKSLSFSNLHKTVCFHAWYIGGRKCAVICEQSWDFIHSGIAWVLCWWEGLKWVQTPSREPLWASQPQLKMLLSETSYICGERTLFLLRFAPW